MDIVKKHLTNGQYLTQEYEKTSGFLHHTIGTNAMSAWRWWNSTPERIGTPYIIDRDGSIIECFNPKMWAYHLGVVGDDNFQEKHSINIELVAAGPLREVDGEFRFYPLWPNKLRYTVIPEEEVYSFKKPWRGFEHWHIYTEDQLESLSWLLGRLALDFPTLNFENDPEKIFEYNSDVLKNHLPGIWTHASVREDKSDPFPYQPLIKSLKKLRDELGYMYNETQIPEVEVKSRKTSKKASSSKPKSSSKSSKS